MLFLIRHASAGTSDKHDPNDVVRPLDQYGRNQAAWIAAFLTRAGVVNFVSSPALRCLQTIQPAADRVGATVVVDAAFAEGSSTTGALHALRAIEGGTAVCLHGDLLPEIIQTFTTGGMEVSAEPSFAKGVVWSVEFDADDRPIRAICELAPGEQFLDETTA